MTSADGRAGPENEDEGESHGSEPLTASMFSEQPSSFPDMKNPWSVRNRFKRAWEIVRGRDVRQQIFADPERSIRQARAHQENRWRNIYAFVLLVGMILQVAFADWFFWTFAVENDFIIEPTIIVAFLSSVVVEVIGLVLVITQSLFPRGKEPVAIAT